MRKEIIFGLSGLVGGVAIGFLIGKLFAEKKQERKDNEEPYYVHLEYFDKMNKEEEPQNETPYETKSDFSPEQLAEVERMKHIDYTAYNKKVQEEKYKAEAEHPTDENEPEEEAEPEDKYADFYETEEEHDARIGREMVEQMEKYRKENEGKIELLRKELWDTDFPEEDYMKYELWYFPDSNELTDENGAILSPIEKFVGDCFKKVGFQSNDDEEIYIRNHVLEENYWIHKETEASREEYFFG